MMDLFDTGIFSFGSELLKEDTSPKRSSKKEKSKSAPPKEEEYTLPLSILLDAASPFTLDGEEGAKITRHELFCRISSELGTDVFSNYDYQFDILESTGRLIVRPVRSMKIAKSNSGQKILYGGNIVEISTLVDSGGEDSVSAEQVIAYLKKATGIDVDLYLVGDVYFPVSSISNKFEADRLALPLTISTLSGCELEITEELYHADQEDEESTNSKDADARIIDETRLLQVICRLIPQYQNEGVLYKSQNPNTVFLALKQASENQTQPAPSSKDKMYPTDAVISLVFTRIPLTAWDFDGKEEISKRDLLRFLQKSYPEYSPERTEIQYDEAKKLIMPILKSGKRGAHDEYLLEETTDYRHEKSFMMELCVSKNPALGEESYFHWMLPKIPFEILHQILYFFWDVYTIYGTEAIVQIFWNRDTKQYSIYIPEQFVSTHEVNFTPRSGTEEVLVMEIHSHGCFRSFWSSTDDANELSHCLYGVVGELIEFDLFGGSIILRAGTGGYHIAIDPFEVFEYPANVTKIHSGFKRVHVCKSGR